MVVLEATVDSSQVERELEQVEDPEVEVEGEMTAGDGFGGGGQETGSMLADISRRLLTIIGIVGVLLQLDTVVELLNGLFRILEVALLPILGIINALLRPLMQSLLQFIGNLDFDNLIQSLTTELLNVLNDFANQIAQEIRNLVGLGDQPESETEEQVRGIARGQLAAQLGGAPGLTGVAGTIGGLTSDLERQDIDRLIERLQNNDSGNVFDMIGNELSNEGLREYLSNDSTGTTNEDSPGDQSQ